MESVEDADGAFVLAGSVRDGLALVVCPVSSQSQFEPLADEFGPAGVPTLAKDTTLHLIFVQYRGPKMSSCELIAEQQC